MKSILNSKKNFKWRPYSIQRTLTYGKSQPSSAALGDPFWWGGRASGRPLSTPWMLSYTEAILKLGAIRFRPTHGSCHQMLESYVKSLVLMETLRTPSPVWPDATWGGVGDLKCQSPAGSLHHSRQTWWHQIWRLPYKLPHTMLACPPTAPAMQRWWGHSIVQMVFLLSLPLPTIHVYSPASWKQI